MSVGLHPAGRLTGLLQGFTVGMAVGTNGLSAVDIAFAVPFAAGAGALPPFAGAGAGAALRERMMPITVDLPTRMLSRSGR